MENVWTFLFYNVLKDNTIKALFKNRDFKHILECIGAGKIDDKGILSSEQYAVGFKKGNTEYRDMVEKTLKDMFDDGTFMSIANKYLDYNLPYMICIDKYLK